MIMNNMSGWHVYFKEVVSSNIIVIKVNIQNEQNKQNK